MGSGGGKNPLKYMIHHEEKRTERDTVTHVPLEMCYLCGFIVPNSELSAMSYELYFSKAYMQ